MKRKWPTRFDELAAWEGAASVCAGGSCADWTLSAPHGVGQSARSRAQTLRVFGDVRATLQGWVKIRGSLSRTVW